MDIIKLISSLNKSKVTIIWIPGHCDIKGNDKADKLAKTALNNDNINIEVHRQKEELLEKVHQDTIIKWQTLWNNSTTGQTYKIVCPNVTLKNKYFCKNRKKETLISRLRLGKCHLNYYLHKINRHATGLCQTCNVNETIEHFLLDCRESQLNVDIFNKCCELSLPVNIHNILNNPILIDTIFEKNKRKL